MKNIVTFLLALCFFAGVTHADDSKFGSDWGTRATGIAFTDDFDSENFDYGAQLSAEKYFNEFIGGEVYGGAITRDFDDLEDGHLFDYFGATVLARYPIADLFAPFGGMGASVETEGYTVSALFKAGVEFKPHKNATFQLWAGHQTNLQDEGVFLFAGSVGASF